jgi:predicted nicotinamide N-methyase
MLCGGGGGIEPNNNNNNNNNNNKAMVFRTPFPAALVLVRLLLLSRLPSLRGLAVPHRRIPAVVNPSVGNPIHLWLLEATLDAQDEAVNRALSSTVSLDDPAADPYGIVLWPAAQPVAALVVDSVRRGDAKRVTELGSGIGLCAIAAAAAGAESVLGTDYNADALALLEMSADLSLPLGGPRERLATAMFDVTTNPSDGSGDDDVLAHCCGSGDLLVAADMLYSPSTSRAVARRCAEAVARGASVVVGDTGRPGATAFLEELRDCMAETCAAAEALDDDEDDEEEEESPERARQLRAAAAAFTASFPLRDDDGLPVVAFRSVDALTIAAPRNSLIATQHEEEKLLAVGMIEIFNPPLSSS